LGDQRFFDAMSRYLSTIQRSTVSGRRSAKALKAWLVSLSVQLVSCIAAF